MPPNSPFVQNVLNDFLLHSDYFIITTFRRSQDALCGLRSGEKVRICLAIFNSSYFEGKVVYLASNIDEVEGMCERKSVSFRTDNGQMRATGTERTYDEWVMSCKPENSESRFDYLLSSAYHDNEILVYFWEHSTKQMFLETLMTSIRISIDKKWRRERKPEKTDKDYDYDDYERPEDYLRSY